MLQQLWGKTAPDAGFHPVLFHMLDVGHIAQVLLEDCTPPRFRRVLAHALDVSDPATLSGWLPLVAALHDIGKISPPFQGQVPAQRQRLEALGLPFTPARYRVRHQHMSAVAVDDILDSLRPLAPLRLLLRDVYAGHHGQFAASLRTASAFARSVEDPVWATLRREAADVLAAQLGLRTPCAAPPSNLRAATAALTGFLILCDWLGSDETHFKPQPDLALEEYLPLSRERARQATVDAGFLASRSPSPWSGFRSVFPDIATPRPLQEAIDHLSPASLAWPGLAIIEAPTGEGKTEAALALARRLASVGWSDELYFALPTMATSDQMFGRVLRFLERESDQPAAVKLIHGQAFLTEHDLRVQALGDVVDVESPAYAAPTWFAPKKRALLAPYGVGTVDQAELSVLSARHYVLRLFGLAGKVVIIDEVHAYDAYMNTIIEHALWWFATLGTPVILLSATLPTQRHRSLARAYRAGLSGLPPDALRDEEEPDAPLPYPALSVYTAHGCTQLSPPAAQRDRRLTLQFVADTSPEEEANRLLTLVQDGGAVARITNTVQRAQAIFAALREMAPPSVELHLLHARLPGDERLAREARLARRLGPGSGRSPQDPVIIVGTQVLEQSLDYDVDLMVSDLAPTDLLLQRAGRLHRHPWRQRNPRFQDATLQVVVDSDGQGAPEFGASAFVYEPFILWKSWLALHARQDDEARVTLTLPDDYRPLIEATYDDQRDLQTGDQHFRSALDAAWEDYQRRRQQMIESARLRLIPAPEPGPSISEGSPLYFEEDEDGGAQGWGFAVTRYGQESISVIPLHRTADGVALDPDGPPLSAATCDRECQLRLLRRAIRISNATLVSMLPARDEPGLGWFQRKPLLRSHYPLVLDGGRTEIGGVSVRLDPELGLVIGEEDAL